MQTVSYWLERPFIKKRGGESVEDQKIIELYVAREELAVEATNEKYGAYCHSLAYGILGNHADAEETVNDTWFRVWNSIPPQRPKVLKLFLVI